MVINSKYFLLISYLILSAITILLSKQSGNMTAFISAFILFFVFPGYLYLKYFDIFDNLDFTQKWVYSVGMSLAIFMPFAIIGYIFRLRIETLIYSLYTFNLALILIILNKGCRLKIFSEYKINSAETVLYAISLAAALIMYKIGGHQDSRPVYWDWIHHLGAIRVITERVTLTPVEWYFGTSNVDPGYGYNVLYVLIGLMAKCLKIDVIYSYLNLHAVFTFVSIFVVYALALELIKEKYLSVWIAIFFAIYHSMYWGFLSWRTILHAGGAFTPFILVPFGIIFYLRYIQNNETKYLIPVIFTTCAFAGYHIFTVVILLFSFFTIFTANLLYNKSIEQKSSISVVFMLMFLLGFQYNILAYIAYSTKMHDINKFLLLNLNSFCLVILLCAAYMGSKRNLKNAVLENLDKIKKFLIIVVPILIFTVSFTIFKLYGTDTSLVTKLDVRNTLIYKMLYIVNPPKNELLIQIMLFLSPILLLRVSLATAYLFLSVYIPVLIIYNPLLATALGKVTSPTLVGRIFYEVPLLILFAYSLYFLTFKHLKNKYLKVSISIVVLAIFSAVPLFYQTHEIACDQDGIPMIHTTIKDVIKFDKKDGSLLNKEPVWDFMRKNVEPGKIILSDRFTSTLLTVYLNNYVVNAYCASLSPNSLARREEEAKVMFDEKTEKIDTLELLNKYDVSYILFNSSYTLKEKQIKYDSDSNLFKKIYSDSRYALYYYDTKKGKDLIQYSIQNNVLKNRVDIINKKPFETYTFKSNSLTLPLNISLHKNPNISDYFFATSQNNGILVTPQKLMAQPFVATKDNLASVEIFVGGTWEASKGIMIVELRKDVNGKPDTKYLSRRRIEAPKMPADYHVRLVIDKKLEIGKKYYIVIYAENNLGDVGFFRVPDMPKDIPLVITSVNQGKDWQTEDYLMSMLLYYTETYYTLGACELPKVNLNNVKNLKLKIEADISKNQSVIIYSSLSKNCRIWTKWVETLPKNEIISTSGYNYIKLLAVLRTENEKSTPLIKSIKLIEN